MSMLRLAPGELSKILENTGHGPGAGGASRRGKDAVRVEDGHSGGSFADTASESDATRDEAGHAEERAGDTLPQTADAVEGEVGVVNAMVGGMAEYPPRDMDVSAEVLHGGSETEMNSHGTGETEVRETLGEDCARIVPFRLMEPPPPGGTGRTDTRQKPVIGCEWPIPARTDAFLEIVAEQRGMEFVLVDGRPCRVVPQQQGGLALEQHTVFSLRGKFVRLVDYLDEKDRHKLPPDYLMQDILQVREHPEGILRVSGIVFAPTVHKDGHIVTQPGYDEHSGLILDLSELSGEICVPEVPTAADIKRSLAIIDDLLHDFPAADQASRANYLALMLTPLVREMIDGCVPAFLVRARAAGTGKTMFVDLVGVIAAGSRPPVLHLERGDDMLERLILSRVRKNPTGILHFDNVSMSTVIRHDVLASLITAESTGSRELKTSNDVTVRFRGVICLNGNMPAIGGDLRRRLLLIDLDAGCARPENRTGFLHEDLLKFAKGNRGAILSALLTLVQHYVKTGMPRPHLNPTGSFESFDLVAGGILEAAGIAGFRGNAEVLGAEIDVDTDEYENLLRAWLKTLGPAWITARDVAEELDAEEMPDRIARARSGSDRVRALGYALRSLTGRPFGVEGIRIEQRRVAGNKNEWRVVTNSATEQ